MLLKFPHTTVLSPSPTPVIYAVGIKYYINFGDKRFYFQFPNTGKLVDASLQTNIVLGYMRNCKSLVQVMKTDILSSSWIDC